MPATAPDTPPPLPLWWAGFAAILIAYIAAGAAIGVFVAVGADADDPGLTLGGTYVQDAAFVAVALWGATWGGGSGGTAALGWRRPERWRAALGWTAMVLVVFYVLGGIYGQLVHIDNASEETVDALGIRTSDVRLAFAAVLLTVIAPVVEETLFRGLLFGALWRWRGWLFGAIISSLVFGAIHAGGAEAKALPVLAVLGFLLAVLYRVTASLHASVAVHAINNAITFTVVVDWSPVAGVGMVVGAVALSVLVVDRLQFRPG